MVVREIRIQAVQGLRDRDGELFGKGEDLVVGTLDADLGTDDEERVFSFDEPSRKLFDDVSGRARLGAHGGEIDRVNRRLDLLAARAEGQRHRAAWRTEGKLDRET